MGSGVSIIRLRKALVIRAYNLRKPEESLDDQFEKFTYTKVDDTSIMIKFINPKIMLSLILSLRVMEEYVFLSRM